VLSKDAHLTRLGWDVHLNTEKHLGSAASKCIMLDVESGRGGVHIGRFVDGLQRRMSARYEGLLFVKLSRPFRVERASAKTGVPGEEVRAIA
jgi:hypothetical protein